MVRFIQSKGHSVVDPRFIWGGEVVDEVGCLVREEMMLLFALPQHPSRREQTTAVACKAHHMTAAIDGCDGRRPDCLLCIPVDRAREADGGQIKDSPLLPCTKYILVY